jgi:ABC-type methionine transport system ATPase subunit
MVGLRLDDLTVAGVCTSVSLDVDVGRVRAVVVRDQQSVRQLVDVLVGLQDPKGGRVLVQGVDVREQKEDHDERRRHRAGSHDDQCWVREVSASGGLLPFFTLEQNLAGGPCRTSQVSKSTATRRARETASPLGLRGLLHRYPQNLTTRQRQLAGLAIALCWRPCAIVLEDSPERPTWDDALEIERRWLDQTVPDTAELLAEVSTLVITTDPARVRHLDPDPVGVDPPDEARGGAHG